MVWSLKFSIYGGMVDLFDKAVLLEEAYQVIKTMKIESNVIIRGSFLSACKEYKQLQMTRSLRQDFGMQNIDNDKVIHMYEKKVKFISNLNSLIHHAWRFKFHI